MPDLPVHIAVTGAANLASVAAAVRRCGAAPVLAENGDPIRRARAVILPGVGAFGPAMMRLRAAGMVEPLQERLAQRRPTLAICLGMQLLAAGSEESPGVAGLGLLPHTVRRLPDGVRCPQMGWSRVQPAVEDWLLPGHAYFAHSYCLPAPPCGWEVAWTEHGVRFVSALRAGGVLACQFHPELSGPWGENLLRGWLAGAGA